MDLSKSDKKKARIIIEKGLMNEFAKGLNEADKILTDWKQSKGDVRESYYALFKHIKKFDKGIASRYDGMTTHDLMFVVIQQLDEGLIDKEELQVFSEDGQSIIRRILSLRDM